MALGVRLLGRMGTVRLSPSMEGRGLSPGRGEAEEDGLSWSSLPTKEEDSSEGLNGLWCWSELARVVESIEGRDVVPVPPVPGRPCLCVEAEDSRDEDRGGDSSISGSPHPVGGSDECAETTCFKGGRFGALVAPVAAESLGVEGVKTRG